MAGTQGETGDDQFPFKDEHDFASIGEVLPEGFLSGEPHIVLPTIAFLFAQPYAVHLNSFGQYMTVQLALYAAGAQVYLDNEQFSQVDEEAQEYASLVLRTRRQHGGERVAELVRYVRERAAAQRELYGAHRRGKATVNLSSGDGFQPVGADLPSHLLLWDQACVLRTIAFLYTHPLMARRSKHCQAIALLSLYAAGCRVSLSPEQFYILALAVQEYESMARRLGLLRNEQLARFARERAESRARFASIV